MPRAIPDDTTDLTVAAVGAAGDGIARLPDGRAGFVPRALPGERWRVRLGRRRGEAGVATEPEALVGPPSPERVQPPCPHFGVCGGCTTQHWGMGPTAAWKRARLAEALARAGFPDAPVAETRTTPPGTRRRADLALRRGPDGAVTLGFHAARGEAVVNLALCPVLDPRLAALFAPLRDLLRRLPALRRAGSAVLNLLDTGADLLLRTDGPLDAPARAALAAFAAPQGVPRVTWARDDGPAETAAQLGPATIRLGGVEVAPPPGAFLQASPAGEAAIRDAVLAGLPARLPPRATVAELYAGIGTLTFPLAARPGLRVRAFEGDAAAAAALATAAGREGARVTAERRDLAARPLTPKDLAGVAAVVLDPPYAGAAEQVALLARARVPRAIYVSCNPAALARDAAPLAAAGYRVLAATPVDQFVWSPHLESVVVFAAA